MRLLWLPEVLRAAGLVVHEVDGWRTRGSSTFDPQGIVCHETRGSRTSTDAGEIRVLLEGSNTAPPPIAQLYLSRSADWHVVASGRCNHALVGWAGPFKGVGNSGLVGIEAQHALGEPWTRRQYDSYVRGVAAIRAHTGWGIAGHKEHQPYPPPAGQTSTKTDPGFDMNQFRRAVDALIEEGLDDMTPEQLMKHKVQADNLAGPGKGIEVGDLLKNALKAARLIDGSGPVAYDAQGKPVPHRSVLSRLDALEAAVAGVDEATVERLGTLDVGDLADILRRGLGDPERVAELAAALTAQS